LVIHEQNARAGLTNRLLSRIATTVLQAFPDAFANNCSAITVGNPVRENIAQIKPELKIADKKPKNILVLGGSQGAQSINQLIMKWLSQYHDPTAYLFWHQTGKRDFESVKTVYSNYSDALYRIAPFVDDMHEAYEWADLAICRAGALTVSELAAAGVPSILIPYPHAADDHQYANALFLMNADAAFVVKESQISAEKLHGYLQNLLSSPQRLRQMALQAKTCAQPNAVADIVAHCEVAVRSVMKAT
jgi:UDP-N-acetylglucosamine--N-acetylmuramyl-(pentapeptide) pyrophosphoryl-undecaprenol N-acetylglucosamine transferase